MCGWRRRVLAWAGLWRLCTDGQVRDDGSPTRGRCRARCLEASLVETSLAIALAPLAVAAVQLALHQRDKGVRGLLHSPCRGQLPRHVAQGLVVRMARVHRPSIRPLHLLHRRTRSEAEDLTRVSPRPLAALLAAMLSFPMTSCRGAAGLAAVTASGVLLRSALERGEQRVASRMALKVRRRWLLRRRVNEGRGAGCGGACGGDGSSDGRYRSALRRLARRLARGRPCAAPFGIVLVLLQAFEAMEAVEDVRRRRWEFDLALSGRLVQVRELARARGRRATLPTRPKSRV